MRPSFRIISIIPTVSTHTCSHPLTRIRTLQPNRFHELHTQSTYASHSTPSHRKMEDLKNAVKKATGSVSTICQEAAHDSVSRLAQRARGYSRALLIVVNTVRV